MSYACWVAVVVEHGRRAGGGSSAKLGVGAIEEQSWRSSLAVE
jgi:hypothetical protein